MADDTYAEELYVADFDIYDYSDSLWEELLNTIELEATLESDREAEGEESEETGEAGDWEWFDKE